MLNRRQFNQAALVSSGALLLPNVGSSKPAWTSDKYEAKWYTMSEGGLFCRDILYKQDDYCLIRIFRNDKLIRNFGGILRPDRISKKWLSLERMPLDKLWEVAYERQYRKFRRLNWKSIIGNDIGPYRLVTTYIEDKIIAQYAWYNGSLKHATLEEASQALDRRLKVNV